MRIHNVRRAPYHLHQIINNAQHLMSIYFHKEIHFSKVAVLSEADRRNTILRLIIDNPSTSMPSSIILKQTVLENKDETEAENLSRFARDWAGLEFLTQIGGHYAPIFYAGSLEHKFILMEDLGHIHASLVGPLTRTPSSTNRQEAISALIHYVSTVGKMHAATAGKSHLFEKILHNIYPTIQRLHYLPKTNVHYIIQQFKRITGHESKNLNDELKEINDFIQRPNEANVLLHGDICPDNVYFLNNQMKLIDFEYGDFGNALIDGVYLRMCMPSCWCSKTVPEDIFIQMENIYRDKLESTIPAVFDDNFYKKNIVFACAYWVIRNIQTIDEFDLLDHEWIGQSGPVDEDSLWDPEKNASRPRVLSRLEAFISVSNTYHLLPNFRMAAMKLLIHLKNIWAETPLLELFPVFSSLDGKK